jgi:hypothetical protein
MCCYAEKQVPVPACHQQRAQQTLPVNFAHLQPQHEACHNAKRHAKHMCSSSATNRMLNHQPAQLNGRRHAPTAEHTHFYVLAASSQSKQAAA